MKELVGTLGAWRADDVEIGRAVVVRTFGSAPRPEGAVLLASSDGRIAGSVSGGCVEGAAAGEIARARTEGLSRVIRYGISDQQAWDVGLACGGTIDVLIEPAVRRESEDAARVAAGDDHPNARTAAGRAVVIPLPEDSPGPALGPHAPGAGDTPGPALVVWQEGRLDGSLGDAALDAELVRLASESLLRGTSRIVELAGRQLFIEAYPTRPRLVLVGGVQVAIPLASMARTLGYETVVIDGRPAFATRERFPDVDRLVVGWPDEVADEIGLGPADSVAILSHDVKFDEPAIVAALAHGCRYVGVVGSKKTQGDRRARLAAAGVPAEDLARLHGPIGLDLGGRAPAETALAIMAEIVAERYGASGRRLREKAAEEAAGGAGSGADRPAPAMPQPVAPGGAAG